MLIKLISLVAFATMMAGCVHHVTIEPEVQPLQTQTKPSDRIKESVGVFIPVDLLHQEFVTPAGGGDKVGYFPYKDIQIGLEKMLANVYQTVRRVNGFDEIGKGSDPVKYVVVPEIKTNSGTPSNVFWHPTFFTVSLTLGIFDEPQGLVAKPNVVGVGEADTISRTRSIAGERAMSDALQKMQSTLLAAKETASTFPEKGRKQDSNSNGTHSSGTGFFVGRNLVLTNQHVIGGCKKVTIKHGHDEVSGAIKASDARSDLALIEVKSSSPNSATFRSQAALGEDLMAAGYPLSGLLSSDLVVTGGQVNSLAGIGNDPTALQISAPVQPGNSGGPLLDKSGNVVGVISSKLNVAKVSRVTGDIAQNVNFAIKPEIVKLFLDANQVQYKSGTVGRKLDGTELAAKAKSITVQVQCSQ